MKGLKKLIKEQKEEIKSKINKNGEESKSWIPRTEIGKELINDEDTVRKERNKAQELEKQRLKELAEHYSKDHQQRSYKCKTVSSETPPSSSSSLTVQQVAGQGEDIGIGPVTNDGDEIRNHVSKKRRKDEEDLSIELDMEGREDEEGRKKLKPKRLKLLPISDIQSLLRSYGHPKILFAETHEEIFQRLLEVEKTEDKAALIRESHRSHHTSNELLDDDNLNELMDSPRGIKFIDVSEIPKDLDENTKIKVFISTCLSKWSAELERSARSSSSNASSSERYAPIDADSTEFSKKRQMLIYNQTKQHLKPLIKRIKSGRLEEEVTSKLAKIIDFCIDKEYVKAHDKYIELAIGNAAWPMGVTMVGIHERVGRSKIFSSEIAHILNDETTRKYIQMIKRLVTLCQTWHPADPSKMVTISSTTPLGPQSTKD